MRRNIIFLFFLTLFIPSQVCIGVSESKQDNEKNIKNVLLLDSYNVNYSWSRNIINGVMDCFSENNHEISLHIEHLDQRLHKETYDFETIAKLITIKYSKIKFDAILVSDNPSFNFVKIYRDQLFPDIPIVFCGFNHFNPKEIVGMKNITGINEEIDIDNIVNLVTNIHSNVSSIVFINSTKDLLFNFYAKQTAVYIKNNSTKLKFYNFTDITSDNLEKQLKMVPDNSVVIILGLLADQKKPALSAKMIAKISPFPVYSNWEFSLNSGVVGGTIVKGYNQGYNAAEMISRILNGEKADNIPIIMETPTENIFDYNVIDKFNISLSSLPNNSKFINEPYNLWNTHRSLLITIIIFIVLLLSAVIILLVINTQKHIIRKNLLKTETQLSQISKNLTNGFIYRIDAGIAGEIKKYTFVSDTIQNFMGISKEEVYNNYQALYDLVLPDDLVKLYEDEQIAIKNMSMLRFEGRLITKEGKIKYFQCTSIPHKNKENHILWDGITIDIEILKKTQEELIHAKLKAEESTRMVSSFLSNLGHEIRTPMNGILGFMNILKTFNFSKSDRDQYINSFNQSAKRFLITLEDIILMSEIQSSKVNLELCDVSSEGIMQNIYDQFSEEISEKSVAFIWNKKTNTDDIVFYTDYKKILKIFSNLIQNAIKYTFTGKIEMGYDLKNGSIIFYVKDTGIGISKDKKDKIFNQFVQVEMNSDRFYEGSGLGLSIAQAFVNQLSGDIWVESEENIGSTFYFAFPIS